MSGTLSPVSPAICAMYLFGRNTNRSQMQEMERWPQIIAQAQELNIKEAGIGCNASWGSNFLGEFPVDNLMTLFEKEHGMWDEVGINVVSCSMGDPMSHCTPAKVEESITRVKERWPEINHFRLHLHNGRNMAIASAYAAMRSLGPDDTLELDGTIGGYGGCPYCGNGPRHRNGAHRGPAPHDGKIWVLRPEWISTRSLIAFGWRRRIMGRELFGHVSKAGPRPKRLEQLYDMNMPFVETMAQARHFKEGPSVYEGGIYPYTEPIASPYRERVGEGSCRLTTPAPATFPGSRIGFRPKTNWANQP